MSKIVPVNDLSLQIMDRLHSRFQNINLDFLNIYKVDDIHESILPYLGEQFHVLGNEGWLQARNNEEKKALIKNSISLHKHKGTRFAVEQALKMFNLTTEIKEWFEYGGDPYCFKVVIDLLSEGLDYKLIERLEDLINEYKNERSKLESFQISLSSPCNNIKIKSAGVYGEVITVSPQVDFLIWDEGNWDESAWCPDEPDFSTLPTLVWDEENWEETNFAYG